MRRGFTLIELLVSIAMVLIIILGVNAIFKMASDTIGAGQALATANRENRSVQSVIYDDVRNAVVTDGPLLLIRSERVAAFRNRNEQLADLNFDPTTNAVAQDQQIRDIDLDGNNVEGEANVRGEVTGQLVYNNRNHRIDRMSFFGRNVYRKQTGTESGGGTTFIDPTTTMEAYHWFGHLDQPVRPGVRQPHASPGENPTATLPNPTNLYAADWILGRSVVLVTDQPNPPGFPPNPNPPNYLVNVEPTNANVGRLRPLAPDTASIRPDRSGQKDFTASGRYDLAETTIRQAQRSEQYFLSGLPVTDYWNRVTEDILFYGMLGRAGGAPSYAWWEVLGGTPITIPPPLSRERSSARFQGYPYPDKPLTPYGLARTVPVWVRGCTQFMVEYAGDYLAQSDNGAITGSYLVGGTDGQLDFIPVAEQSHPSLAPRSVRRIRWYGMPRNVDIQDDVNGPVIAGAPAANPKQNNLYDVIPLRDLLAASGKVPTTGLRADGMPADFFEHFVDLPAAPNYAQPMALTAHPNYYAAWGPNDLAKGSRVRPKMLRITMTVDDPNGRLSEGQTFEYVIDLP